LWIIPLSGDGPVLLEMDVSVDGRPFLFYMSPNFKKLAFSVKSDDGTEDLFVVPISLKDARTTGPAVKVFDGWYKGRGFGYDAAASWSPDGNKLAVIHGGDVWIASSNGDKPVQITKTPEKKSWPGWSPDGNILCYGFKSESGRILQLIPASGGKATKVLGAGRNPTWSPDSKEIVAESDGKILAIPIDSGKARKILDLKEQGLVGGARGLCWLPDGKHLTFISEKKGRNEPTRLFVVPAKGGKVMELASDDDGWKDWIYPSPDGKWISYNSEGNFKTRPQGTIWEVFMKELLSKGKKEQKK